MVALALGLSACGSEPPAPAAVAALGDSITEGTNAPPADRYTDQAAALTGRSFRTCGVFGERTDEIASRLNDCADGADILVVQGGINDLAQGRAPAAAAAGLRELVRRGRREGRRVLLADVLPWNNGFPQAAGPIRELNAMIDEIARETGVERLRFFAAIEDPGAPDRMKPEWTVDGDHPSAEGHRRLAEVVARAIGEA